VREALVRGCTIVEVGDEASATFIAERWQR
jgi:hypothetical protein